MFEDFSGGVRAYSGMVTPATALRRGPPPRLVLRGPSRSCEAGATIYAQSDPADFIYQVATGVVRTITVHRDGRRIVLVDDVLTSGATVSALAKTLKRAGAGTVDVLSFARVVFDSDMTV